MTKESSNYIDWSKVKYKLKEISDILIVNNDFICFGACLGGISKSAIEILREIPNIDVLIYGKVKSESVVTNLLTSLFPTYWIIVRIYNPNLLYQVMDELTDHSIGELYFIESQKEEIFYNLARDIISPVDLSNKIEILETYFLYGIDGDCSNSNNELVEYSKLKTTDLTILTRLFEY